MEALRSRDLRAAEFVETAWALRHPALGRRLAPEARQLGVLRRAVPDVYAKLGVSNRTAAAAKITRQ